jgi:hypothetical protein
VNVSGGAVENWSSLTVTGLHSASSVSIDGKGSKVNIASVLNIEDGSKVELSGGAHASASQLGIGVDGTGGSARISGQGTILSAPTVLVAGNGELTVEKGAALQAKTAGVFLAGGGSLTISDAGSSVAAEGVALVGSASLTVKSGGKLTVNTDLILKGGNEVTVDDGTLNVGGNLIIDAGSELTLEEASHLNLQGMTTLNGGTILVTNAFFSNLFGASVPFPGGALVNSTTIEGHGTISVDNLKNSGTIEASGGTLSLRANDISGFGSLQIDAGSTLELALPFRGLFPHTGDTLYEPVTFKGAGGVLKLVSLDPPGLALHGFRETDFLELGGTVLSASFVGFNSGTGGHSQYVAPELVVNTIIGTYKFFLNGIYTDAAVAHQGNTVTIVSANAPKRGGDGYFSGATVFADANNNGVLDGGEVSTTTDQYGGFNLIGGTGPLVLTGGTDALTGLAFQGALRGPADSLVMTPLTTLVQYLIDGGASELAADQSMQAALGLTTVGSTLALDPAAAAYTNDATDAAAFAEGGKVLDTVTMIAAALAGVAGAPSQLVLTKAVFAALASEISGLAAGSTLDLNSATGLAALVGSVAQGAGITLQSGASAAIAAVIAATNAALDQKVLADQAGVTFVTDVSAVERVAQGATSNALDQAAGNTASLQNVVNSYSGTNLANAIAQADSAVHSAVVTAGYALDLITPTVTSVTPSVSGEVSTGATVHLTVSLSDGVTVDTSHGSPTLLLSNGATATYDAGASNLGTGALVFDYAVGGAGERTADLTVTQVELNGAVIQDATDANPADFSGAEGLDLALQVGPAFVRVVEPSQTGDVGTGEILQIALALSQGVTVTGTPTLTLTGGLTATYDPTASDPASGKLVFDYIPAAGDYGVSLAVTAVNLAGGTINDGHGVAANLSGAIQSLGFDVNAAIVSSVTPSQTGEAGSGTALKLTLTMGEAVTAVGGVPTLTLNDGATATYDPNASNPAAGVLVFDYTVGGEQTQDLRKRRLLAEAGRCGPGISPN